MISLKKYIESNRDELLNTAMASYRSALQAMGASGVLACPVVGVPMQQSLQNLQQQLSAEATPQAIRETEGRVSAELGQWGQQAADYFKQRTTEVKEIMLIMAHTAEVVGERDQRYSGQFQEFTERLEAIADLHDLKEIRDSLVKSAKDLKACAEKMTHESQESVEQLRQDVGKYQVRLDDAERLAGMDALTGLDNRRKVESAMEFRLGLGRVFSIMILDLNEFKQINDTHGHVAGDEVLKQFGSELKGAFRSTDVVGRWGGDEFVVVLDCGAEEMTSNVERLRRWVFGDYTVQSNGQPCKLQVEAAAGVATWKSGDTLKSLLARADAAMYQDKRSHPSRPAVSERDAAPVAGGRERRP